MILILKIIKINILRRMKYVNEKKYVTTHTLDLGPSFQSVIYYLVQ